MLYDVEYRYHDMDNDSDYLDSVKSFKKASKLADKYKGAKDIVLLSIRVYSEDEDGEYDELVDVWDWDNERKLWTNGLATRRA